MSDFVDINAAMTIGGVWDIEGTKSMLFPFGRSGLDYRVNITSVTGRVFDGTIPAPAGVSAFLMLGTLGARRRR